MTIPYEPPEFCKDAFNCPSCGAFANMHWTVRDHTLDNTVTVGFAKRNAGGKEAAFASCACLRCREYSYWLAGIMFHPMGGNAPLPHGDMPTATLDLYEEAANVSQFSPRAAAALLRLAVETLVNELEPGAGSLNDKIGVLVKKGLHPMVQKALDAMRVIGNNAVHPGEIKADDPETVSSLYKLLNLIVEEMIEKPKHVEAVFNSLPEGAKAAIEKRAEKGKL